MRRVALAFICVFLPSQLFAQADGTPDDILDALQFPRLLAILQTEAVASGEDLARTMAPERRSVGWTRTVSSINDPDVVGPQMRRAFAAALPTRHVEAILVFWQGDLGQEIVALELSAREAMLDESIEAAIMDRFAGIAGQNTVRVAQLRTFIDVNDLVDTNVVGALNANAAFLQGLRRGAPKRDLGPDSDSGILAEVWNQEPEIRLSTVSWLYAFLSLAYQPLSETDLSTYIAFSESDAGQAFNRALFSSFDRLFVSTSRETGVAFAQFLTSEDI